MESIYELRGAERVRGLYEFIADFKFPLEVNEFGKYEISEWFSEFMGSTNAASICNTALGVTKYYKGVGDHYNLGAKKKELNAAIVKLIQDSLDPVVVKATGGTKEDKLKDAKRAYARLVTKFGQEMMEKVSEK